jgi:target of rapamycin complex 2 subunit MAPKAP1
MAEALDLVCRRRNITNPKEWALMLKEPRIPIPLDRTVASLQGKSDLLLIKRSEHPSVDQHEKRVGRTTDPNGDHSSSNLLRSTNDRTQPAF